MERRGYQIDRNRYHKDKQISDIYTYIYTAMDFRQINRYTCRYQIDIYTDMDIRNIDRQK